MVPIIRGVFTMKWRNNLILSQTDIVVGINRRYLYLAGLLIVIILYIAYGPFKSLSSEIVLLFTSNSPELIVGYLNSYNVIKPIVSIGLMIFQALIVPFKYKIIIFANKKIFGTLIGFFLSCTGRAIGAYICFDVGRTLVSDKIDLLARKMNSDVRINNIRRNGSIHIFVRLLPLNFGLVSYLTGALGLDPGKYMINSIVWITITTAVYSLNGGYYNYSYEIGTMFIRFVLSVVILARGWRTV